MGDGIESTYRPRRFEGRKAVGRPSYYQRESISVTTLVFVISAASVFLIPTAFGLITPVIRWFDWARAKYPVVFLMSLTLGSFPLYGIVAVRCFTPEVVYRYMLWKLLDRFLGSKRALALSDHLREVMPSLAACNPFLTDAVCHQHRKVNS